MPPHPTPSADPVASVIVVSHDAGTVLHRCLAALADQVGLGRDAFEVVVVDCRPPGARELERPSLQRPPVRILRLEGGDAAAARNAGVEAARGRICVFLDEFAVPSPEFVAAHVDAHATADLLVCLGTTVHRIDPLAGWYAHAYARSRNRAQDAGARGLRWWDCSPDNLSVRSRALADVGGFAADLPGAPAVVAELAFRLEACGYTCCHVAGATVTRVERRTTRELLTARERQGSDDAAAGERRPAMASRLLGWFGATTPREIVLRRAALRLHLDPVVAAYAGRLLPGDDLKQRWFDFTWNLSYWQVVRASTPRERWHQLVRTVPVLLYHAVDADGPPDRFVVTRRKFARQMRLLSLLRFEVVEYDALAGELRQGRLPGRRAATITFDDGYLDNVDIALPILRRRRFPATIFLVSGRLGGSNDWSRGTALDGRRLLTATELAALREASVDFGAHTRTHAELTDVSDGVLKQEVAGSRRDLESILGAPVDLFSYPYGRFDRRAVEAAAEAGFVSACTTEPRPVRLDDDPLRMPRIEVRGSDSLLRFAYKLWFGGR